MEPRSDDLRVVDDQQVARAQLRSKVPYRPVEKRTGHPVQYQQAPARALGGRLLGNQLGWKVVSEVLAVHACMLHGAHFPLSAQQHRAPRGGKNAQAVPSPKMTTLWPGGGSSWSAARRVSRWKIVSSGSVASRSSVLCWRTIRRVIFSPGW